MGSFQFSKVKKHHHLGAHPLSLSNVKTSETDFVVRGIDDRNKDSWTEEIMMSN